METQPADLMTVQARLDLPFALIEVQRIRLPGDIESDLAATDDYRIDFSLTSRTPDARMSFQDRWPAHRFETLGKVYLVPPGEAVRARSGAGTQEAVICLLRQAVLDEWLEGQAHKVGRSLDASLDIRNTAIAQLMTRLGDEARDPGFASAVMCEALAMQIGVELGRYYRDTDKAAFRSVLAPWQLRLIDQQLREARVSPALSELAQLCGISVRHLTRGFRASRGCSIGDHIRGHQIDLARSALAGGESIKMVAHRLGFSSRSSFSHAFQKATGMAPRQFRQHASAERFRQAD